MTELPEALVERACEALMLSAPERNRWHRLTEPQKIEWRKDMRAALDASGLREAVEAMEGLLERYVGLVNCGDCGFWDPEQEVPVKAARAALARIKGAPHA